MTERIALQLGRRDLLVVAGIPGAGKTTLLARAATGAMPVLDSDQVRARLRGRLPAALPYRCYRPLVHLWHRARVVRAALADGGPLVVHEPSTRATTRGLLALLGLVSRRPVRLLWLDVTPEEARAGQVARGRVIRPRSFARHVRRAEKVRRDLRAGWVPAGWHGARMVTREVTGALRFVTEEEPGRGRSGDVRLLPVDRPGAPTVRAG
ncbi:AAA family ATPase [Amycolatopsis sp. BJA-103]|uniref:AAA family ATPase n=1 Tax=unclassified Amycolatopsis TaxID=2618356 RepID=UPI000C79417D|nr:AAA family ATPase [Amycolatopsis sp. BJA-103]AUI63842.1 Zeta toxin [Amycolatopsis sp. BJA-103]PNE16252.1 Zeta toxin [Amycolatopsis sp. BJA-103]